MKSNTSQSQLQDNSIILHAITKEGAPIIVKQAKEEMGAAEVKSLRQINSYFVVELLGAWKVDDMHCIALPVLKQIDWNDPTDEETLSIIFQLLLVSDLLRQLTSGTA